MRWIVWYLRSVFCAHEWRDEERWVDATDQYTRMRREGVKVSATCRKCGWHRAYWKHLS